MKKFGLFLSLILLFMTVSFTVERNDEVIPVEVGKAMPAIDLGENLVGFINYETGELMIGHHMESYIVDGAIEYKDLVTEKTYTSEKFGEVGKKYYHCICSNCGNEWCQPITSLGECPSCGSDCRSWDDMINEGMKCVCWELYVE